MCRLFTAVVIYSESLADIANERAGLKRFNDSKKPLLQCTNGESIDRGLVEYYQ